MAFPASATIDTAIDNLLLVADEDPKLSKARQLRRKILEVATLVEQMDATYDGFFAAGTWTE